MLTGPEKAVLFLLSLDEEVAAPIVNELKEADLRKLRAVASTMREVSADAIDDAYKEFVERSSSAVAVPRGGLPYLRRLTVGALGEPRAREVFEDGVTSPLARLEAAPPDAVASLLANEPPLLAGALLARLDPSTAARVLAAMPEERQAAVLERVGMVTELPAGALEDIASALASDLPSADAETLISIDGVAKAAEILNAAGRGSSVAILQRLEEQAPELAERVRLAMFTFDDLARVDPRNMRLLVREVPTERLTVALKGAGDAVVAAVFAGLSQRAAELLRDDLEILGNVKRAEIEKARTEIITIALRLESDGALDLGRGDDG
jgi:flagellar motor switch protein FliG